MDQCAIFATVRTRGLRLYLPCLLFQNFADLCMTRSDARIVMCLPMISSAYSHIFFGALVQTVTMPSVFFDIASWMIPRWPQAACVSLLPLVFGNVARGGEHANTSPASLA